ncbi:hypothetical protein N9Z27_01760 [Alphaproteobacteria bacterium]|nr:hypothetical protein [Alphaproteobacteria bacterium]
MEFKDLKQAVQNRVQHFHAAVLAECPREAKDRIRQDLEAAIDDGSLPQSTGRELDDFLIGLRRQYSAAEIG